jgi:radical SAM-linked protein
LPWDHLDAGVSRQFLQEERDRAYRTLETPDCRQAGCQDCGRCDEQQVVLRLAETPLEEIPGRTAGHPAPEPVFWSRLVYAKLEEARWLGHLEVVNAVYRSLRRSGLPLAYSHGHHPLPRVAFHGALPLGVESLCETLDVGLAAQVGAAELASRLNRVLPAGMKILSAEALPGAPKPPRRAQSVYEVESPQPVFAAPAAAAFLDSREFPVVRRRPKGDRTVDVRVLVAALETADACHVKLALHQAEKGNLKVTELLGSIFALTDPQVRDLQIVKVQVI